MGYTDQTVEKLPPQNIDAEMAVLGAMLLSEDAVVTAMEKITPDTFYLESHRIIYGAILDLFDNAVPIDAMTINEVLQRKNQLEKIGGAAYIASLVTMVPSAAHIEHYIKIIYEKYILRSLISVTTSVIAECYDSAADAEQILDKAEQSIYDVSQRKVHSDFTGSKELIKDTIQIIEDAVNTQRHVTGTPTGYYKLDEYTSGLQNSDLIIIAARPSMGKTAFALNIAEHVALHDKKAVAVFSLEMAKEQLIQRMLCSLSRIDFSKVRRGFLAKNEWPSLLDAASKLSEAKVFIDDTPAISAMEIRAKARRLKSTQDIGLIVIDYLQMLGGGGKRYDSRQQEISDFSRALKSLARELNIPVIVLSQLNRSVETRTDHRPMLSDLRESGSIEQDADVVLLMVRPEYYDKDNRPGETDVFIAKQRNGPVGEFTLRFFSEYARFENFTQREEM
ncbi:replicative DNA helicase [bacterium]|nr:replicative DNA helicase [bacterium]MCP5462790.1 replicative DNA helicase [bacterium]